MRNAAVIAGREIRAFLATPMTYFLAAVFLFFSGVFFATYLGSANYEDTSITGFVEVARLLILLFAALLTMGLIAEERKLGTWELVMTAPVRDHEIVLGKFAAAFAILGGILALTLYFPFLLFLFGDPDIGPIVTSYLALLLLGGAALAVGIFASSLTSSQVVSAAAAAALLFALWFLAIADTFVPGPVGSIAATFSLAAHFDAFVRGIVRGSDVVYYLNVMLLFLFLATQSIESIRWR